MPLACVGAVSAPLAQGVSRNGGSRRLRQWDPDWRPDQRGGRTPNRVRLRRCARSPEPRAGGAIPVSRPVRASGEAPGPRPPANTPSSGRKPAHYFILARSVELPRAVKPSLAPPHARGINGLFGAVAAHLRARVSHGRRGFSGEGRRLAERSGSSKPRLRSKAKAAAPRTMPTLATVASRISHCSLMAA